MNFCSEKNLTSTNLPPLPSICTATNFKIKVIRSTDLSGIGNCVTEVKFDSNKENFVVWNKANGVDGGNALGNCSTTKFDLTQKDLIVLAEKIGSYVFKHFEFYIVKFRIAS